MKLLANDDSGNLATEKAFILSDWRLHTGSNERVDYIYRDNKVRDGMQYTRATDAWGNNSINVTHYEVILGHK